jgi:hypothetical protein
MKMDGVPPKFNPARVTYLTIFAPFAIVQSTLTTRNA